MRQWFALSCLGTSRRPLPYTGFHSGCNRITVGRSTPTAWGIRGQFGTHLMTFGVESISGKSYTPTTQGKNERFLRTRFRFLDK